MTYDNTNSGALFKNNRKSSSKQPDYNGSIDVGGVDYWISGWIKTSGPNSKNPGSKFMSLALTKKDTPQERTSDFSAPPSDFDNDVPF